MLGLASSSVRAVVLLIVIGPFLPLGWRLTLRLWRGHVRYSARNPWPQERQEAMYRAFPGSVAAITLAWVALLIDVTAGAHSGGGRLPFILSVAAGFAIAVLSMAAYFARRPQWVIPPALRDRSRGG